WKVGQSSPLASGRIILIKIISIIRPMAVFNACNEIEFIVLNHKAGGPSPSFFRNFMALVPCVSLWIENIHMTDGPFMRITTTKGTNHINFGVVGDCLKMMHFQRRHGHGSPLVGGWIVFLHSFFTTATE